MASDGTLINPSTDCVAMPEYTNLNDVIVDGRVESSAQGRIMGSFAVMPAASILNENCIILYSGTTGTYVSGQFYMCVESGGSYSWQPVTISGTEEDTYTANRALATNAQGQVVASGVTATELGYLSGLGGSVSSLLNGKVDKVSGSRLMTDAEGTKLSGIAAGAQVNVIEAVQNNGVAVPVSGKTVNITHPTKLSEFTNDTQFITSTVSNLQNYYDKTNVDALISAIPKFSIQVSQSGLPASGNSTTIYLVPKTAGSQDAYDEYLYVNGQWEKIGSTAVQFSFDQSGTNILINGTAIREATTSQSGVMTATQVGSLNTAVSGVSNLQSQYGTLNSTVSDISGRLGTVESTLSTTVSQMSTLDGRVTTLESSGSGAQSVDLSSSSNMMTCNVDGHSDTAQIINSFTSSVSGNKITISVNGVSTSFDPIQQVVSNPVIGTLDWNLIFPNNQDEDGRFYKKGSSERTGYFYSMSERSYSNYTTNKDNVVISYGYKKAGSGVRSGSSDTQTNVDSKGTILASQLGITDAFSGSGTGNITIGCYAYYVYPNSNHTDGTISSSGYTTTNVLARVVNGKLYSVKTNAISSLYLTWISSLEIEPYSMTIEYV